MAIKRYCTCCMPTKGRVLAKFVASGPEDIPGHPMQWFECGEHSPLDNLAGVERVNLEPIEAWFAEVLDPIELDFMMNYSYSDAVGAYVKDDVRQG